jgi:hypothetical protein
MTKPQRSASKGRDPSLGLSLKAVHMAFIDEKPAKERGVIAASEPEYIYIYIYIYIEINEKEKR